MRLLLIVFSSGALGLSFCQGAEVYRITSTDGKKTHTYELKFGGSSTHNILLAFCPKKKAFVSLAWHRTLDKAPEVAATIWDSHTGRTLKLYRFPGCADPLPVIDDIQDLKVCPFTGDKNLKAKRIGFAD
jgi:hypothetical protein